MNLLAIDAAGSVLSVAVARGEDILYAETEAGMKHSELVMDCIDDQMKKAGLVPGNLDGILCMGGPGSFTGLRIGYSIAKGLALALGIPFAPVPTLDCIALEHNAPQNYPSLVLPVIEARKNAYFFTIFRNGERLIPDTDAAACQIAETLRLNYSTGKIFLTGPAAALLYDSFSEELKSRLNIAHKTRGYARELITIAKNRNMLHNDNTAYLYSGPEYIRKTDAELNLSGKNGS